MPSPHSDGLFLHEVPQADVVVHATRGDVCAILPVKVNDLRIQTEVFDLLLLLLDVHGLPY